MNSNNQTVTVSTDKKNSTWQRVFWGIVFLAFGVLVVLYATGVSLGSLWEIPVLDMIIGVILLSWIIRCLVKVRIPSVFLPLGLLFCTFEDEIATWCGKNPPKLMNHWLVLLVVVLLTAGSALLLRPWKKKRDPEVTVNSKSSSTLYIDCSTFTTESVKNELGATNIWFSNKELYAGGGTLCLDNELGATIVHVPPEWQLDCKVTKELGSVTTYGTGTPGGKLLTVTGKCELGSVTIKNDG